MKKGELIIRIVAIIYVIIFIYMVLSIHQKAKAKEISQFTFNPKITETKYDINKYLNAFNLDALAYAVSGMESNHCTSHIALTTNNCFGIRRGGEFVKYDSMEDSFDDFKRIWTTYYGGVPTLAKANKYSGGDGKSWLKAVTSMYNKYIISLLTQNHEPLIDYDYYHMVEKRKILEEKRANFLYKLYNKVIDKRI